MTGVAVPVRAVVFDLWLTLIPFPPEVRAAAFERTAAVLGLSPDELRPHWTATRVERETTELRTYLRRLGESLSAGWTEATIDAAVEARTSTQGACFANAFDDGRDAIAALRERGLRIGLVSNCTSDVRDALLTHGMDRWFDEQILSAEVGVMKPAPEIFELAARRLGVDPAACLYVADGVDNELVGAAEAGMTPLLYDRARAASDPTARAGAGVAVISSHLELLGYLDR